MTGILYIQYYPDDYRYDVRHICHNYDRLGDVQDGLDEAMTTIYEPLKNPLASSFLQSFPVFQFVRTVFVQKNGRSGSGNESLRIRKT